MQLSKTQRLIVGTGLGLILAVVGIVAALRGHGSDGVKVEGDAGPAANAAAPHQASATVMVHVVGAVRTPEVYALPAGSRVRDAVTAAGGATADAQLQWVNLAAPLSDGQQVIIPERPAPALPTPTPVPPAKTPDQPSVPPAAAFSPTTPAAADPPGAPSAGAGAGASGRPGHSKPQPPATPISINAASAEELQALPHIGPALAARIVEYRTQHGPFQKLEDLRQVKGLGPKIFADIAPHLSL